MSTLQDAWEEAVDALIADSGLSKLDFGTELREYTDGVISSTAGDFIDAVATEYNRLGLANNSNYAQLRNAINNDGADLAKEKFEALSATIFALPETAPILAGIELQNLRAERDEFDTSINTMVDLKDGQTKQVLDALNIGIDALRAEKQRVRDEISNLTGDPDSTE